MSEPVDPLLLFNEDDSMFVLHDPAMADQLIESADEFVQGYDGHGRLFRAYGEPGKVTLAVVASEAQEELRTWLAHHYSTFATCHLTPTPPQEVDLAAFIRAVAEGWVEEQ
ncbi:hypothetical protein ABZY00_02780 [Streptomyces griseoflavus]|uniref:hypothetical protein n=1 Tax=Streptomyces griseoflavus TaxID=35619 RepID=UPI0033AE6AEE